MTQPQLAEMLKVSSSQMNSFCTGNTLTGSPVYTQGMKYLRARMPISQCSTQEREEIVNDKWTVTFGDR
jgi:hypothetical protein